MAQLGRLYSEFQAADTEVLVILGESLEMARSYAGLLHLPFPVLSDPERTIYHQFGLEKGIFGLQRTASILIDAEGIIRYIRRTTDPNPWLKESQVLLQKAQELSQK